MRMTRSALLVAAVAAFATGCEDLGFDGGTTEPVSVSFATLFSGTSGLTLQLAPPIGDGTHTIDLQGVTLDLDELVLERDEDDADVDSDSENFDGDSDSEDDSDSDGAGSEHFSSGPISIDLPLDSTVVTAITTQVPSGRYEELELDLAAVRLVGTYDDEPFDVLVPLDLELEVEFDPSIVVQDELNLTVALDLETWLREADGSVIDPRALATDAAMRSRLMQRIALSLDAFEDSDHDADSDSD